jgi:hypothetical protein
MESERTWRQVQDARRATDVDVIATGVNMVLGITGMRRAPEALGLNVAGGGTR